ncbi:MAG: hypothetical protein VYA34_11600, partial [Myxococcota bacterium]|nr:hypothetical protein [Myxococcota bacterium]
KDASKDKPKGISKDKPKGISKDKPKGISKDKPKGISKDKPKGISKDKPKIDVQSDELRPNQVVPVASDEIPPKNRPKPSRTQKKAEAPVVGSGQLSPSKKSTAAEKVPRQNSGKVREATVSLPKASESEVVEFGYISLRVTGLQRATVFFNGEKIGPAPVLLRKVPLGLLNVRVVPAVGKVAPKLLKVLVEDYNSHEDPHKLIVAF